MLSQVLAGSICSMLAVGVMSGNTAALAAQATDGPTKLSGVWTLNKELSTDTSQMGQQAVTPNGGTDRGGGGGGRRTGGGRRGGFGGGGRSGTGANQEQMAQMRALWREITETPAQVTIVATASAVTFTDDQGMVRKYAVSGKKESIDLGTAKIDATTKWDHDVLVQDMTGGSLKASWKYQVTIEGHQLVVTITTEGGQRNGGPATPITRIYDKG
jgi:hypothetical protein